MKHKKNPLVTTSLRQAACAIAAGLLALQSAKAHPYASGVTNSGGTIKFFLNESNVTSVKVAFDNNTVTNDLSALGQTNVGVNSFALGAHTNYTIIVSKTGSGVPSLISPIPAVGNSSSNLSFFGPRGVAVNTNPKKQHFGRIYVANASPNTTISGVNARASYKGLYALNPSYTDAFGLGTNSLPLRANFPGGGVTKWWGSSTTFAPYRLWVGQDDQVYVGDSSGVTTTTNGCPLWMMDPNLTAPIEFFSFIGTSQNSGGGTTTNAGPIQSKPFITGSLANGDLTLTCTMYNYYQTNSAGANYQSVLRYNIGSGPIDSTHVWGADPVVVVTNTQPGFGGVPGINAVLSDLSVGPNGYIYVSYPRSGAGGSATGNNNVYVYDNQVPANLVWGSSLTNYGGVSISGSEPTNDCFVAQGIYTYGCAVSADTNYIVFGNNAAANWVLVRLTNGVPDSSTIQKITASNSGHRSIAFDAANNVYTVDGNSDSLRVYSLGQSTTCYTYNDATGTNGTFRLVLPPTSINVVAVPNQASQTGPTSGLFTITRAGQNLNLPLTISFSLGGTASNGVYTVSPAGITPATNNTITFAANQTTTNITITPVVDSIPRPTTTVILSLVGGTGYSVSSPANATVFIQNTVTPAIFVTAQDTQMYERTNDYARFRITRQGNTNVDLTTTGLGAVNIGFGGTAQVNVDYYTDPAAVDMPPGMTTTNIKVFPIHNGTVTGDRTITAFAAVGTGYNPAPSTGTVTIVDSDLPPETVLWSDAFSTDTSADWTFYFGTIAGVPDDNYRVNSAFTKGVGAWPFDFSVLAIPSAPHTTDGSTKGLFMTVNKDYAAGSGNAASALNFYPNGKTFSGNYALRFDMFLVQNDGAATTEYGLFGINHDAAHTNWFRSSSGGVPAGWSFDGIFFDVESDGAALGDYVAYSSPTTGGNNPTPLSAGRNASTLTGVFKTPPWTPGAAAGGASANRYGTTTPIWADVEISQVNGIVTWKINQTLIFSLTNATAYTSGNIMLGYEDGFDSVGATGGSVIYANARVVSLANPVITAIQTDAINAKIDFSANAGDTVGQFTLQSASLVTGPYNDVASTITSLGGGNFRSTVALNGSAQFYRVKRLY